jgi:hypothetical protein
MVIMISKKYLHIGFILRYGLFFKKFSLIKNNFFKTLGY